MNEVPRPFSRRPFQCRTTNIGWDDTPPRPTGYKHLGDGRRQIVAFFLPGDLCDHIFILREMDHSIATLTPVTVAGDVAGVAGRGCDPA